PEMCREVESYLDEQPVRSLRIEDALAEKAISVQNLKTAHYRAVKKRVDFNRIAESGLRVAHDALFGVGAGCFEDRRAGTSGRVVKAITTTSMVDKICRGYGLELVETPVGFKYICAELLKGGVLLGFEESGGIAFPGYIPERDGLLAGLALLEMLATEKVSL